MDFLNEFSQVKELRPPASREKLGAAGEFYAYKRGYLYCHNSDCFQRYTGILPANTYHNLNFYCKPCKTYINRKCYINSSMVKLDADSIGTVRVTETEQSTPTNNM